MCNELEIKKSKMKTVTVLLSTYNGEKYLREQIDSLLNQKGVNVKLYIRDDGSSDSTIDIINSYDADCITLYKGENIGPARSFVDLVRTAPISDYYAYCGQDDVWFSDKLMNATEMMGTSDSPLLYMSTYDVVDEKLQFIRKRDMNYNINFTIEQVIVHRSPSACTMVFNKKLREILCMGVPESLRMHDYWTLMTLLAVDGRLILDDQSRIQYRQHGDNTVGCESSLYIRIKRLFNSALYNKNERQKQAISVYKIYEKMMSQKNLDIFLQVYNYNNSLINKIKFAFSSNFVPSEPKKRILFRLSVLLGVF